VVTYGYRGEHETERFLAIIFYLHLKRMESSSAEFKILQMISDEPFSIHHLKTKSTVMVKELIFLQFVEVYDLEFFSYS
jgi:hypothetical protein